MVAAVALPVVAAAGDDTTRAVSGPNGKISVEGGSISDSSSFLGLGSYTVPLGRDFGAQFDAAFGNVNDHLLGGGGVHLFMRDPSRYLLGVYGSYHTWNDIDIWRAAGEAELYQGRVSFGGLAGVEAVRIPSATDDDHFFGQIDVSYYPTDDLKLSAGYDYENQTSLGTAGVEYLMHAVNGLPMSIFAKARFGESDYQQITAGLRVHFGGDPKATLIARHRTADPDNYVPVFPVVVGNKTLPVCQEINVVYPKGSCTCPASTLFEDREDGMMCYVPPP